MKKYKVKNPILVIESSCGNLGTRVHFVSKVTEKTIQIICNDRCVENIDRASGLARGRERSGLSSVVNWHYHLKGLEAYLQKLGVITYDTGICPAYNTRDEQVYEPVIPRSCSNHPTYDWLKSIGCKLIDCR